MDYLNTKSDIFFRKNDNYKSETNFTKKKKRKKKKAKKVRHFIGVIPSQLPHLKAYVIHIEYWSSNLKFESETLAKTRFITYVFVVCKNGKNAAQSTCKRSIMSQMPSLLMYTWKWCTWLIKSNNFVNHSLIYTASW